MISLTTAESALKDAYLNAVTNQLNTNANPLLAKIKQSSADVFGKDIIKMAPVGLNGGVGAGDEVEALPASKSTRYAQFKTTLKNLYGQISISDKAIRASQSNSGAFVDLLNAEMEGLLTASKFNLGRMLYGDGSGALATVTNVTDKTITFNSVKNLAEGVCIDFYAGDAIVIKGLRVVSVNRNAKTVIVDTIPTGVKADDVAYVQGSKGYEITGLGAIFGQGETLYGLNRANNQWLNPYISTTATEISDTLLQTAVDYLAENSASNIDIITCGAGVRRAYMEYLSAYRRNIDVMNLAGGYKAISFNGIPVVADRFVEDSELYMLDTSKFTLHQLCDWEWIEGEGGNILHQTPGHPTYTATLVKYADLICDQPNGQAKFTNLSTSATNPFAG